MIVGFVKAALREADEEIGISPRDVEIWGDMRPFVSASMQSVVTPVVGALRMSKEEALRAFSPQTGEVDNVFLVGDIG